MYIEFLERLKIQLGEKRNLNKLEKCEFNSTSLEEYWECIKESIFDVKIIQPGNYDRVRDTSFNWTIIEYTQFKLIM